MSRTPGIDKARIFVLDMLRGLDAEAGHVLPPIAELAGSAQVSFVTMWKAVDLLGKEGVVGGTAGRRKHLLRHPDDSRTAAAEPLAERAAVKPRVRRNWEKVKVLLSERILAGRGTSGTQLPLLKELCRTYGMALPTIRRALTALAAEGLVEPYNRGWRVVTAAGRRRQSRVLLVTGGDPASDAPQVGFEEEFLRGFEIACMQARIALDKVLLDWNREDPLGDAARAALKDLAAGEEFLGCVYFVNDLRTDQDVLVRELARIDKPLAVFDIVGWRVPPTLANHRLLRLFTFASRRTERPGMEVARYLWDKGHRHIAYVSPFHGEAWSVGRFSGLASIWENARGDHSLTAVTSENDPNAGADAMRAGIARRDIRRLLRVFDLWEKKIPDLNEIHFGRWLGRALERHFLDSDVRVRSEPLFERARGLKGVTAWVCANDAVGVHAMDFLGKRRIDVPGRLSVIGFDDTPESVQYGLSTYNFNVPGIANAALMHLAHTDATSLYLRNRTVEVRGVLVERRTTGAAPRRS